MIYGIGHDVVELTRIDALLTGRLKDKFIRRILTQHELHLAESREGRLTEFVAGRFAAKEAVVKAFGCGIGETVGFTDIEIVPGAAGKPEVFVSEGAWARLALPEGKGYRVHLTITHERRLASAFAIVEAL